MNHYNTLNVKLSNSQLDLKFSIKVIKFLENRGILLKGTTRKITGQEEGFSNFLRRLMTAGLSLMKKCTLSAKNVLLTFGLSAADPAIHREFSFLIKEKEISLSFKCVMVEPKILWSHGKLYIWKSGLSFPSGKWNYSELT